MNGKIEEYIYVPVIITQCGTIESSIAPGLCEGGSYFFEMERMAKHMLTEVMSHPSTSGGEGKLIKYKRVE